MARFRAGFQAKAPWRASALAWGLIIQSSCLQMPENAGVEETEVSRDLASDPSDGSPTPKPSPTVTVKPTPTPTVKPSATPTAQPTVQPTSTSSPTPAPSPTVTKVPGVNQKPIANAGSDLWLHPGTTTVTVAGSSADDGKITRHFWSVTPAGTPISGTTTPTVTISGLEPGVVYVLSYIVTDDGLNGASPIQSDPSRITIYMPANLTASESGQTIPGLHALEAQEIVDAPAKRPSSAHPRLYGSDSEWLAFMGPLDQLPCLAGSDGGLGVVSNVKTNWEMAAYGFSKCKGQNASSFSAHPLAKLYYAGTPPAWNRARSMTLMHLLRRVSACHDQGRSDCGFTKADLNDFRAKFIAAEVAEFRAKWVYGAGSLTKCCQWVYGHAGYDIYSSAPFVYWNTFLDTFWNQLAAGDKQVIETEMSLRIDAWLQVVKDKFWGYSNGNNWNGNQSEGLVAWAVTHYHEDPTRAKAVLRTVLDALWLHRDFYLESGYFKEGSSYFDVSFASIRRANRMILNAFGKPIRSMKWDILPRFRSFFLDHISPDGQTIDFGDAHIKTGYSSLSPIHVLLPQELTGKAAPGSSSISACDVKEYFAHKYHANGLTDPWDFEPMLARDWLTIAESCASSTPVYGSYKVVVDSSGGQGALRSYLPGSTALAAKTGNAAARSAKADETFMAVAATPSSFPHRELDFRSLIWSVHGSRLLWDWGYGQIVVKGIEDTKNPTGKPHGTLYDFAINPDFLPSGSNTLSIPDALDTYNNGSPIPGTDFSQIFKEDGTSEKVTISGIQMMHLDGSIPYGSQHPKGWMKHYDSWVMPAWNGHFILVDAFQLKEGKSSRVQENFYTFLESESAAAVAPSCTAVASKEHVDLALTSSKSVTLVPRCSLLFSGTAPEGVGRIIGASLHAGRFTVDPKAYTLPGSKTTDDRRRRFIYSPDVAVNSDVRVFLMLAATEESKLPSADVVPVACGGGKTCFRVTIGSVSKTLTFGFNDGKASLESIQ